MVANTMAKCGKSIVSVYLTNEKKREGTKNEKFDFIACSLLDLIIIGGMNMHLLNLKLI